MKTAEEITHELLISSDTVGYQRSHVIQAMETYSEQFKSIPRALYYKCIKDFNGFTDKSYRKGQLYHVNNIHIAHQSNFEQFFEVYQTL